MADAAISAPITPASTMSVSYRRGPMSSLLAWMDSLPGHGWWVIALFALILLAWGNGILWAAGRLAVGTLDFNATSLLAYGPYGLATLLIGRHIASTAVDTFWPATGWPEADKPTWTAQFANTPAGIELAALVVGVVGGIAALVAAPSTIVGAQSDSLAYYIALAPSFVAGYSVAAVGAAISFRWLWLVTRIHREATAIDPFDRRPIYAFSRLTVLTGLAYIAAVYYSLTVNGAYQAGNLPSLAFLSVAIVASVAAFVAPLWGIHVRITRERDELLRDVDQRINQLGLKLYGLINSGSLESTSAFNSLLTTLGAMRERILRLPTWPWPPNLFRGFLTALLLPILIFLVTRVISTYLS